jgi:ATP-dependent NAD(P)H-hydrate dehydratase
MSAGGQAIHQPSIESLHLMMKSVAYQMSPHSIKGQAGTVAVVGGSPEYTGAPYFSAISALKVGGDLSHVFCSTAAGPVIKSYSPELIVHPILDVENSADLITRWLKMFHVLVIGPGLGRDPAIYSTITSVIEAAKLLKILIVIDADGLSIITDNPSLIKGYKQAVITPNAVEFARLEQKLIGETSKPDIQVQYATVLRISQLLGNVTVIKKGEEDIISDGVKVFGCKEKGSNRRCGGQGDLLSGTLGTLMHWTNVASQHVSPSAVFKELGPTLCASYTACHLLRRCAKEAFHKFDRSTTTTDILDEIPHQGKHIFN